MSQPLGVYRPGTTVLHRLPVGPKLLGLIALSVTVVALHGWVSAVALLVLAAALAASAHLRPGATVRALRGVVIFAAVVALLQWWWSGPERAVESLLDLTTLALLALTLSTTTATIDMLEAFTRWMQPLRRVGIDPERVALTISMTIGAIPGTTALATETRDAARARGLERSPRAYLTPFVIRVVARAHETGAALQARGLGD